MKKFIKAYQYVLLFLLIATSGFPFFYSSQEFIIIGTLLAFAYSFLFQRHVKIDTRFLVITVLLCSWELFQGVYNGEVSFRQVFGSAFRLSFAYFVLKALGGNFINKYLKTIRLFSIISLVFYALFFIPGVTESLIKISRFITPIFEINTSAYQYHQNIILFNFHGFELTPKRNSGPFWEPGAFSIFLVLAIVFDYFQHGKILWLKNLPLFIALVTTLSTAGYITMLAALLMISFNNSQSGYLKRIVFFLLLTVIGFQLIVQLDFMGTKISQNIDLAQETTSSRFGSALADFKLFVKNPIVGYGRNIEAMYGVSFWDTALMHRNNGLTKLFVTWGIMAFFIIYLIWISSKTIGLYYKIKYGGLILFVSILLSGFSQGIFQYPFFMIFYFINTLYLGKRTSKYIISQ